MKVCPVEDEIFKPGIIKDFLWRSRQPIIINPAKLRSAVARKFTELSYGIVLHDPKPKPALLSRSLPIDTLPDISSIASLAAKTLSSLLGFP
jgi:hypothetical protein